MLRSCYYYSWRTKSSRCIGVLNAVDWNLSDARPPSANYKALKSSKQAQKGLIGVLLKSYETPAGLDETLRRLYGTLKFHKLNWEAKWRSCVICFFKLEGWKNNCLGNLENGLIAKGNWYRNPFLSWFQNISQPLMTHASLKSSMRHYNWLYRVSGDPPYQFSGRRQTLHLWCLRPYGPARSWTGRAPLQPGL